MTIQGYARQLSVYAGDELQLCVSTTAPYFRAEFFRQGAALEPVLNIGTGRLRGWELE